MYGYWGKMKKVKGKYQIVWIGPMTKNAMLENHDTYRHNFKTAKEPLK